MANQKRSDFSNPATGRAVADQDPWLRWLRMNEEPGNHEQRAAIVLVTARWVMIIVGIILTLNAPDSLFYLQVSVAGILALAGVNFVLHTNLVMKKRPDPRVLEWTSAGDVVVICTIAALTGGVGAYAFVFLYPAILAYSLALPLRVTLYLTTLMVALYGGAMAMVSSDALNADPAGVGSTLVTRLVTFVAVMAVANMYRWVEFRRVEEEAAAAPRPATRQRPAPRRPRSTVESAIA